MDQDQRNSEANKPHKPIKTPKRPKQSIKHDAVAAKDILKYKFMHSCEYCSHWNPKNGLCTLGYKNDSHRLEYNLHSFEISGRMSLCRFLEID